MADIDRVDHEKRFVALIHDLPLVARNTAHVQGLRFIVLNPWEE